MQIKKTSLTLLLNFVIEQFLLFTILLGENESTLVMFTKLLVSETSMSIDVMGVYKDKLCFIRVYDHIKCSVLC